MIRDPEMYRPRIEITDCKSERGRWWVFWICLFRGHNWSRWLDGCHRHACLRCWARSEPHDSWPR